MEEKHGRYLSGEKVNGTRCSNNSSSLVHQPTSHLLLPFFSRIIEVLESRGMHDLDRVLSVANFPSMFSYISPKMACTWARVPRTLWLGGSLNSLFRHRPYAMFCRKIDSCLLERSLLAQNYTFVHPSHPSLALVFLFLCSAA